MDLIDIIFGALLISDVRKGENKHEVIGYLLYALLAIALITIVFFCIGLACDGAMQEYVYSALPQGQQP